MYMLCMNFFIYFFMFIIALHFSITFHGLFFPLFCHYPLPRAGWKRSLLRLKPPLRMKFPNVMYEFGATKNLID